MRPAVQSLSCLGARALGMVALLASLLCARDATAQSGGQTRLFRVGESRVPAITFSPRGKAWARSDNAQTVTWFDGYVSGEIPVPDSGTSPVHESRSGQLWTVVSDGILVMDVAGWKHHPITEVAEEIRTNTLRRIKTPSIVPAEVNRVFILLFDRLLEFDAGEERIRTIKTVQETPLGRFSEMVESKDGSLWITAANGFAKVPGTLRRIGPETPWEVHVIPSSLGVENLLRPTEVYDGGLITVGSAAANPSQKSLVEFVQGQWKARAFGDDRVRHAWSDGRSNYWGMTFISLFHAPGGNIGKVIKEPGTGGYYDVAQEPGGAFWVATSDGAVRHTPLIWERPSDVPVVDSPIHAMLQSPDQDGLWIAAADAVYLRRKDRVERFDYPDDQETVLQPSDSFFRLKDGRIALSTVNRSFIVEPDSHTLKTVRHPGGRTVRFIGSLPDGSLCARTARLDASGAPKLESFDGTGFHHFLEISPEWNLGTDPLFAQPSTRGGVWVGFSGGLGLYDPVSRTMVVHGPAKGLPSERVSCVLEFPNGQTWAGGAEGVYELRGQRWERISTSITRVNAILPARDGSVWVASAGGLHHNQRGGWIPAETMDGLPATEVTEIAFDQQDRLWVGTIRGLVVHHPEADPDPPKTLAPQLETGGGEAEDAATVLFNGRDKWDVTQVARLLYSHRVDEGAWSEFTPVSYRSFRNLGAGPHRLDVQAMDRNGNRALNISSLDFKVTVAWYKDPRLIATSTFGFLVIVGLAALAVNRHLQLIKSYAEVEKVVKQRTEQLEKANQDLLHAQKMRALGTLAAGIAHDFNNILSVIKGSAQIIEANLEDKDRILVRVARIQTVVEQGSSIVRSLLGIGRTEGQALENVEPARFIDETLRLFADRFPPTVQLQREQTGSIPAVSMAPHVLQQMLLNLLLNAVEASESKGRVTVRSSLLDSPQGHVALEASAAPRYLGLSVIDSGAGIAKEVLPRIFEPFYTTKAFSSRRGTGLGLSMVYELAKSLGYGLTVDSEIGRGTQFTILVPVEQTDGVQPAGSRP